MSEPNIFAQGKDGGLFVLLRALPPTWWIYLGDMRLVRFGDEKETYLHFDDAVKLATDSGNPLVANSLNLARAKIEAGNVVYVDD